MVYSNDWAVTNNPADHSKFKDQPSFVRKVRQDIQDRLNAIFYGFASGETQNGVRTLPFVSQGTALPATISSQYQIHQRTVGGVEELFLMDPNGNTSQFTTLGKLLASAIKFANLVLGDLVVGGSTDGTLDRLAAGTSGQLLVSHGTGAAPSWASKLGNTPGLSPINTNVYVFSVSGLTTVPTSGATYTNGGNTYTVTEANAQYVYATGSADPAASGTLTKSGGTGDSSISYSAFTGQLPSLDVRGLLNNYGAKVQSGSVTAQGSFTISNLVPGKRYRLVFNMKQNTSDGAYTLRFNGDSGNNYAYGGTGPANGVGPRGQSSINLANYSGANNVTYATGNIFVDMQLMYDPATNNNIFTIANTFVRLNSTASYMIISGGDYAGAANVTSLTIATSAGTMTGSWALYEIK